MESDHCYFNIQTDFLKIHHKPLRILKLDIEKSAVRFFEFGRYVMYGDTNCTALYRQRLRNVLWWALKEICEL